jgi:hypothetical protein
VKLFFDMGAKVKAQGRRLKGKAGGWRNSRKSLISMIIPDNSGFFLTRLRQGYGGRGRMNRIFLSVAGRFIILSILPARRNLEGGLILSSTSFHGFAAVAPQSVVSSCE